MSTKELRDRRAVLKEQAEAIFQRAADEGREDITPSENKKLNEIADELQSLKIKINKAMKHDKEAAQRAVPIGKKRLGEKLLSAFKEAEKLGMGANVDIDITEHRAFMSTDGSGTAAQAAEQLSTAPSIVVNPGSKTEILSKMSWIPAQNNTTYPYISDANKFGTLTQTDQSTALTPQAAEVSSFTTSFYNEYTLVKVHADLLRDSSPGAVEDVIKAISKTEMSESILDKILYDTGTNITGLASLSGVQSIAAGATSFSDYIPLLKSRYALAAANTSFDNVSALVSPALNYQLNKLVSSSEGLPLTPPPALDPLYKNGGLFESSIIRDELGNGTNKLFIGDFSEIKVYYSPTVSITLNERYRDADQIGFMMVMRLDVRMFNPAAMCIITGLQKGASIT